MLDNKPESQRLYERPDVKLTTELRSSDVFFVRTDSSSRYTKTRIYVPRLETGEKMMLKVIPGSSYVQIRTPYYRVWIKKTRRVFLEAKNGEIRIDSIPGRYLPPLPPNVE